MRQLPAFLARFFPDHNLSAGLAGELASLALYVLAALAEIAGCSAFWAWRRTGASAWWLAGGLICLVLFAWLLTFAPSDQAGRAFAAYGGIYIVTALLWLWLAEGTRPTWWDLAGAGLALLGAVVILLGTRATGGPGRF
ncbi:YnfA family protein [Oecophyllibacter saccharovorans]|uniref:YnfA family protein n=1 Tax=Oecophyllibacter saccharovorans TaxID=2558360 RepID=A0A506UKK7_9PROT|nr:YnfA family protein [Oecophyllibacter saccharovorans]